MMERASSMRVGRGAGGGPNAVRPLIRLSFGLLCAALVSCGGGGGGGSGGASSGASADAPLMLVGPSDIQVAATTADSAPSALMSVQFSNLTASEAGRMSVHYSTSAISSITFSSNATAQQAQIYFKAPASLGAGVYHDTIEVSACYGGSCTLPMQGSPLSVPVQYTVTAAPLVLSATYPATVVAGGPAFTLAVLGKGLTRSSTVLWNGSARATSFVSGNELLAQIKAEDIAASGAAAVTVSDPNAPNGMAGPQNITVGPPSVDATSFQINPAHTGAVSFSSVSFPSKPAWSVDVGGVPSYALIADGDVFVTVSTPSGETSLLALDQATGATAWGPIAIASFESADATYDNGNIFVMGENGTVGDLFDFDARTGNERWDRSASFYGLSGQFGVPVAAQGLLFATGATSQSSAALLAIDEVSAAQVWETQLPAGAAGDVGVSVDGVYIAYDCITDDFRPAMGESVWSANSVGFSSSTTCTGVGGAPVIANQLVFSSQGTTSNPGGTIFAADSGTTAGTYPYFAEPTLTPTMEYFLSGRTLSAVSPSDGSVQWTFTGDGLLNGQPIAVNQYVIVGSSSGNLYALDGATGALVWSQTLPTGIDAPSDSGVMSDLAAGDGLLLVPSGNQVVAYVLSNSP